MPKQKKKLRNKINLGNNNDFTEVSGEHFVRRTANNIRRKPILITLNEPISQLPSSKSNSKKNTP